MLCSLFPLYKRVLHFVNIRVGQAYCEFRTRVISSGEYCTADHARPVVAVLLEETHCILSMKHELHNTTRWYRRVIFRVVGYVFKFSANCLGQKMFLLVNFDISNTICWLHVGVVQWCTGTVLRKG